MGSDSNLKITDGVVAGSHPERAPHPLRVGPATEDQLDTFRPSLFPVACWRLHDLRFAFDSSFIAPEAQADLRHLAELRLKHAGAPLSIFGHADPVGKEGYNKILSGRRAKAVYALLTRNTDMWEDLYSNSLGGDVWSLRSIQVMLRKTGDYDGPIDGKLDSVTPAVQVFQGKHQLTKGSLGPKTRRAIFLEYMNVLCGDDLSLTPADFLAKGLDLDANGKVAGKGDFQGCDNFNPVRIFSKDEKTDFDKAKDKTDRDDQNSPNRRVMVLLFKPGSFVHFKKWPCPRAHEGTTGCHDRFWSDAKTRLENREVRREFDVTHDTFGCRFYQRISNNSPCERIVRLSTLRLRLIDDHDNPYEAMTYRLEVAGQNFEGSTTGDGVLEHHIPEGVTSGKLTLIQKPEGKDPVELWTLNLEITPDLTESLAGAQARLNNLGFFAGDQITGQNDEPTHRALQRFQTHYKVTDEQGKPDTGGILTVKTAEVLKDKHGS